MPLTDVHAIFARSSPANSRNFRTLGAMRIARVIAKLEPGGAQLAAVRLVSSMQERGIETRLLAGCATPEGIAMCVAHGIPVDFFGAAKDLQYATSNRFARWMAPRVEDVDV